TPVSVEEGTPHGEPGLGIQQVGGGKIEDARTSAGGVAAAERQTALPVDSEEIPGHAARLAMNGTHRDDRRRPSDADIAVSTCELLANARIPWRPIRDRALLSTVTLEWRWRLAFTRQTV